MGVVLPRSISLPIGTLRTVVVNAVPEYLNIGPRLRTYKQAAAMTKMSDRSQPRPDRDSSATSFSRGIESTWQAVCGFAILDNGKQQIVCKQLILSLEAVPAVRQCDDYLHNSGCGW